MFSTPARIIKMHSIARKAPSNVLTLLTKFASETVISHRKYHATRFAIQMNARGHAVINSVVAGQE